MKKVIGVRAVLDLLKLEKPSLINISKGSNVNSKVADIISLANAKGVKIRWLKDLSFRVEALIERESRELGEVLEDICLEKNSLIIVLDHIQDVGNLGSIIRSAESFGVKYLFIPKRSGAKVNDEVSRISAGAIANVEVVEVNINSLLDSLKKLDFWVYGADLAASDDFMATNYSSRSCLVMGNEEKGLSRLTKEKCDFLIKIPMVGQSNSLNVSVSCGIILSKMSRVLC